MSFQHDYHMTFTGDSTTRASADQTISDVGRVKTATIELGTATQEAVGMSMRAFSRLLFTFQMGIFYVGMLTSAIYQSESAAIAVENAQDSYNRAIREYGVNSEQAVRAERTLVRTRKMVETANLRAKLSYVGMGLQVVNLSAVLLRSAGVTHMSSITTTMNTIATKLNVGAKLASVGATVKYVASTIYATAVDTAHAAVLWAKAHALTIITFGAAAAAGAVALYAFQTQTATHSMEEATKQAEKLHETIGEAPSFGLVKSFEDLSGAMKAVPNINIGGTTNIYAGGEADLRRALEEDSRRKIEEFRRRR